MPHRKQSISQPVNYGRLLILVTLGAICSLFIVHTVGSDTPQGTGHRVLQATPDDAQPNCLVMPGNRVEEVSHIFNAIPSKYQRRRLTHRYGWGKITNTGVWSDATDHFIDLGVADAAIAIMREWKPAQQPEAAPSSGSTSSNLGNSLLELGAGIGCYSLYWREKGISFDAYDGMPTAPERSGGVVNVQDLTAEGIDLGVHPWVLSLEVGEHIPKKYESQFIHNIVAHAGCGVMLSWAVPGQAGYGHVNCQSNEYIIGVMDEQGFQYEPELAQQIRSKAHAWFKNTPMVFTRKDLSNCNPL